MWSWVTDNSDTINVVLNAAMLFVWLGYFHLLHVTFKKQNRPNILINRGAGEDLESRCIVANMSPSPIYVQAVKVEVTVGEQKFSRVVSDTEKLHEGKSARMAIETTAQGPVAEGDLLDLGKFSRLIEMVLQTIPPDKRPASPEEVDEMEVTVFAVYTARNDLVGASRRFRLEKKGEAVSLIPTTIMAVQKSGWRQAKHLAAQYPLR